MPAEDHIIEKLHVRITVSSIEEAESLRDNFVPFLQNRIFSVLEKEWDGFSGNGNNYLLDRVVVKIQDDLKQPDNIREAIRNEVVTGLSSVAENSGTPGQYDGKGKGQLMSPLDAMCYFLQNGSIPFWTTKQHLSALIDEERWLGWIRLNIPALRRFALFLTNEKVALDRLINQYSDSFLEKLFRLIADVIWKPADNGREGLSGQLTRLIKLFVESRQQNLLRSLLMELTGINSGNRSGSGFDNGLQVTLKQQDPIRLSDEILLEKEKQYLKGREVKSIGDLPEQVNQVKDEKLQVENAGIIIVHPFLKHFFLKLGLLDENDKLTNKAAAVQLLHYVATGDEGVPEYELVLEKLICGMTEGEIVPKHSLLTSAFKMEAEQLLGAVLEYWNALGNSSIELLRNEYLMRPGRLKSAEEGFYLTLERKLQDILLDRIPWNIGLLKFPWSGKMFYITW